MRKGKILDGVVSLDGIAILHKETLKRTLRLEVRHALRERKGKLPWAHNPSPKSCRRQTNLIAEPQDFSGRTTALEDFDD
jgi:hypothetical protein